jgi:hypothetical protein
MRAFAQRIVLTASTSALFVVFSEMMFWGRFDYAKPDLVSGYLAAWALYSVIAYVVLWMIAAFRVAEFRALFLVAAIYGWLLEGVAVQTMYEQLPLSIAFTGLAWHALLTVEVGWFALRRALQHSLARTARLALLIGIGWGLWSVWWWTDQHVVTPLPEFASYAFLTALVLAAALWLATRLSPEFRPSRAERLVVLTASGLYFVFVTVPGDWRSLVILPPCLAVALLALRRNRETESRDDLLQSLAGPVPFPHLTALVLMPVAAVTVYGFLLHAGLAPPTGWVLYLLTVPTGFVLFVVYVIGLLRGPRGSAADRAAPGD